MGADALLGDKETAAAAVTASSILADRLLSVLESARTGDKPSRVGPQSVALVRECIRHTPRLHPIAVEASTPRGSAGGR